MRKVLLVLTVLALTAPCWAAVSVSCSYVGETVTVSYNCTGDANDIRAFGIQIEVDNGATISNIDVNEAEYYIFPGSIDINGLGLVDDWGSAVVDQTSSSFILEMGSLYDPCDPVHKTVPPKSGTLCTFDVGTPVAGCAVSVSRDTSRGGVVMEDGNDYATLTGISNMPYAGCYTPSRADWATWNTIGRPPCWCYPRQCYGDADGQWEGGGKIDEVWVGTVDLGILSAAWQTDVNDPNFNACADFDRLTEGGGKIDLVRVGTVDLGILSTYWMDSTDGGPDPGTDCNDAP